MGFGGGFQNQKSVWHLCQNSDCRDPKFNWMFVLQKLKTAAFSKFRRFQTSICLSKTIFGGQQNWSFSFSNFGFTFLVFFCIFQFSAGKVTLINSQDSLFVVSLRKINASFSFSPLFFADFFSNFVLFSALFVGTN